MAYLRQSEEYISEPVYEQPPRYAGEVYEKAERYTERPYVDESYVERRPAHYTTDNYKRNERVGELGTLAAGGLALYEAKKTSADPSNAARHTLEAELAGVTALGSAGYALYEHHEKQQTGW